MNEEQIQQLLNRVNASPANFVSRLKDEHRKFIQNGDTIKTHLLGWAEMDDGAVIYPQVQEIDGNLVEFKDWKEALNSAIERKDTVQATPEEAEWFTTHYKNYYPKFTPTLYKDGGELKQDSMDTIKATINNKEYSLLHAKSDEEKESGLMNCIELQDDEGCLFDYRNDLQKELSFWMKSTPISLDILFINEDNEIIKKFTGEPESEDLLTCTADDDSLIKYVIEINPDKTIKEGDSVEVEGDKFELPPNKMLVLNSDGSVQFQIAGGERIFSRISSCVLVRKAKKAWDSKEDVDYKGVGRYLFQELSRQDNREPEYVESPK